MYVILRCTCFRCLALVVLHNLICFRVAIVVCVAEQIMYGASPLPAPQDMWLSNSQLHLLLTQPNPKTAVGAAPTVAKTIAGDGKAEHALQKQEAAALYMKANKKKPIAGAAPKKPMAAPAPKAAAVESGAPLSVGKLQWLPEEERRRHTREAKAMDLLTGKASVSNCFGLRRHFAADPFHTVSVYTAADGQSLLLNALLC
jgi:hypothetical protein